VSPVQVTCAVRPLEGEPPRWSGPLLHGAVLGLLREADPAASEAAHEREPRPLTVSGLYREGGRLLFRCSGLAEPVSSALESALSPGMRLPLGPAVLAVEEVAVRRAGYRELYERFVPQEEGVFRRVGLRFLCPTTFRVGKANMPFPLPRLLWRSWAARWNAFSGVGVGSFEVWAEEFVVPSRFRLRSVAARSGEATLVGALGECEYVILRPRSLEARVAAMLASYAPYCGSGQKTAMGLGTTELLSLWTGRST